MGKGGGNTIKFGKSRTRSQGYVAQCCYGVHELHVQGSASIHTATNLWVHGFMAE